jgi:hypothetical protein
MSLITRYRKDVHIAADSSWQKQHLAAVLMLCPGQAVVVSLHAATGIVSFLISIISISIGSSSSRLPHHSTA